MGAARRRAGGDVSPNGCATLRRNPTRLYRSARPSTARAFRAAPTREGISVRISENRAFIPDALVVYPAPLPDDREISNPLIVVEPFSRTAEYYGLKLEGYFSLPSLAHYLILDTDRRVVIHHARGREGVIETRILHDGRLRLDPPGLEVAVAEFFASAD